MHQAGKAGACAVATVFGKACAYYFFKARAKEEIDVLSPPLAAGVHVNHEGLQREAICFLGTNHLTRMLLSAALSTGSHALLSWDQSLMYAR